MKINLKSLNQKQVGVILFVLIFLIIGIWSIYQRMNMVIIDEEEIPLATFGEYNLYTIENEKFGISNNGQNAAATTQGINDAIQWAKQNGYEGVKLASGRYLIRCSWNNPYTLPNDGILIPSNTVVDLQNAVLQIESNSQPAYNIIYTLKGSNIIINGGTLVGDKNSHTYSGGSTHEWGCGINVVASSNVTIQNMTIYDMTGDAITIRGGSQVNSNNFTVTNNQLYNCRRQGISVTGGINGVIQNNQIYGIRGADPQCGIDIEANDGYDARNLTIQNNYIADCGWASIQCYNGSDYVMQGNTCVNGGILVGTRTSGLKVLNNKMVSSIIRVLGTNNNAQVSNNSLDKTSKVEYRQ